MPCIFLRGHRRSAEYRAWSPWLHAVADLVARFDVEHDDDPLAYNETASVSLLAAGAARAGHLGIAEFGTVKGDKADGRRPANGRCDFWMGSKTKAWGFEFKQLKVDQVSDASWLRAMAAAKACANRLRPSSANQRVAGLIVPLYWQDEDARAASRVVLRELADCTDFAWELRGSGRVASDTFVFFDLVGRSS